MLERQKAKYYFPQKNYDIPFRLPNLSTNNQKIKQKVHIKILEVLLDKNLSWKKHPKHMENKCTKNIGFLHRAKAHLNQRFLLGLHSVLPPTPGIRGE